MSTPAINPAKYDDDKLKSLAVLLLAKKDEGINWLSAPAISQRLRDAHGIGLHWKTIYTLLSGDKANVHRRKRGGQWEFGIMQSGTTLLVVPSDVTFVDPSQAVHRTLEFHSLLAKLTGLIRVCDPYLDGNTIQHLEACPTTSPLRLLTKNISDSGPLRQLVAAAQVNLQIEVRRTNAPLHDRYILDQKDMFILGTSLNGFGKKQCFIIRAGQDIRSTVLAAFDTAWNAATPWP